MDDCKTSCTRRNFCVAAGAGLGATLLLGSLSACDPNADPRIGEGALDPEGNGTGGNGGGNGGSGGGGSAGAGGSGGGGSAGAGGSGGGGGTGGTGGTGGGGGSASTDMAGGSPPDMATAPSCTAGTINAGSASSITVGGTPKLYKSGSTQLFVVRDAGGLFAVSAICTHSGCTNEYQSGGFYCPCHGATFKLDGSGPTSPAHTALKHYAMCVDASGNVTVDPKTTVATATRY